RRRDLASFIHLIFLAESENSKLVNLIFRQRAVPAPSKTLTTRCLELPVWHCQKVAPRTRQLRLGQLARGMLRASRQDILQEPPRPPASYPAQMLQFSRCPHARLLWSVARWRRL